MKCNWGADYADPETWTDPFSTDSSYSFIFKSTAPETQALYAEYTELVAAAKAITDDMDARYTAFAKAEAFLLDHAFAVPFSISNRSYQMCNLNVFEGQYASFGLANQRYKGSAPVQLLHGSGGISGRLRRVAVQEGRLRFTFSFWQFITREALIWGLLSKPHIYGIAPQAIFRSLYRCCYGESSSGIGSDASFVKMVKNRFSRPFSKRPAAQPQKKKVHTFSAAYGGHPHQWINKMVLPFYWEIV